MKEVITKIKCWHSTNDGLHFEYKNRKMWQSSNYNYVVADFDGEHYFHQVGFANIDVALYYLRNGKLCSFAHKDTYYKLLDADDTKKAEINDYQMEDDGNIVYRN